ADPRTDAPVVRVLEAVGRRRDRLRLLERSAVVRPGDDAGVHVDERADAAVARGGARHIAVEEHVLAFDADAERGLAVVELVLVQRAEHLPDARAAALQPVVVQLQPAGAGVAEPTFREPRRVAIEAE